MALGLCLLASLACSQGEPDGPVPPVELATGGRPSILLVTLDTTRADHLGPYGAKDAETPALSGLANSGIVFEQAVAVAPVTAPTHASLLTGLYPRRHGLRNNLTHHLDDDVPTLAERLAAVGYRTAAFVSAIVLDRRYGLDRGFEVYDDDLRSSAASRQTRMLTERPGEATADLALAWLDEMKTGGPYFLWVHFYDPHLPFAPPSPWAEEFSDRPYDGEIAYMDSQVGRLLRHPRVADDNTVVIVVGDHGEGLGEHGEEAHGLLVYESTIRVPWILRLPGGPAGLRIATPVSQVDLMPTVLDVVAAGSGHDSEDTEGRSLLPLLGGHDPTPERLLFAESEVPFFTYGWVRLRAVRQDGTKYIDAPVAEFYDLDRDPEELANLASERKDDVRFLAAEIETWKAEGDDGGSAAQVDAATAEMLRAIGYVAGDPGRPEGEGHGNPVELIWVHEELQDIHGQMVAGAYEDAVRRVHAVLDKDPENLSALRDLSRCLLNLGRLDEAAEAAATATTAAPWSAQAFMVAADIEHRRGNSDHALVLIDQALSLDDRLLEALLDRSRYLAKLGRTDEARLGIETLIAEYADNPWVALRYVEVVELPTGEFRSAEDRLRGVLVHNPYLVEAWLMLGKVFVTEGRPADAIAVYREAIEHRGDHADLQARLALLLSESAAAGAEIALRKAIESSPAPRADLHLALGERLAAQGRRDEARREFETAATAPTFSAGTRNARGMALLRLGRVAEAEEMWRELIRDYPDYGRAWLNLSSLSIRRRKWVEAEQSARVAVEWEPHIAAAWNNLGIGLEELGRTPEAETAYRRAGEVDARDWRGLFNLGILLRKTARYEEAVRTQREVLDRNPAHGGAHFELGMLLAGPLNQPQRAKVHLQAAIAADPDHPRSGQARAALDRLP